MKPSELRLGNWIEIRYKGTSDVRQSPMDFLDIREMVLKQTAYYFEPIPLTEEWLLKFGFEKDYDKTLPYQEGYIKENIKFNSEFQLMEEGMEGDLICIGKPLKHVHQLQNLYFALTEEELEVKETVENK